MKNPENKIGLEKYLDDAFFVGLSCFNVVKNQYQISVPLFIFGYPYSIGPDCESRLINGTQ